MSAAKRGTSVKGKRIGEVYQLAHSAWRAGVIHDFYFGQAAADDLRTVWRLDSLELEDSPTTRKEMLARLQTRLASVAIPAIDFGPSWCGYRSLTVTYADGRTITQRWDGNRVILEEVAS